MAANCLDGAIPRKPKPHPFRYEIEMELQGEQFSRITTCEQYYISSCDAAGNGWIWRRVGFDHDGYDDLESITVGGVSARGPTCSSLVTEGESITIESFWFDYEGTSLFMDRSINDGRSFFSQKLFKNPDKDSERELTSIITIDFGVQVTVLPNN